MCLNALKWAKSNASVSPFFKYYSEKVLQHWACLPRLNSTRLEGGLLFHYSEFCSNYFSEGEHSTSSPVNDFSIFPTDERYKSLFFDLTEHHSKASIQSGRFKEFKINSRSSNLFLIKILLNKRLVLILIFIGIFIPKYSSKLLHHLLFTR